MTTETKELGPYATFQEIVVFLFVTISTVFLVLPWLWSAYMFFSYAMTFHNAHEALLAREIDFDAFYSISAIALGSALVLVISSAAILIVLLKARERNP